MIDLRDVYTLLGRHVDVMKDIGSRAAFEQNAAPGVAMARAAGNMMSPSATQREQQEEAAAQGLGGGVGALGGSVENAIVAAINNMNTGMSSQMVSAINNMNTGVLTLGNNIKDRFIQVETRVDAVEDMVGEATEQARAAAEKAEAVEGVVGAINGRVGAMDGRVGWASETAKAAAEKVAAVDGKVGDQAKVLEDVQSKVAEMQAKLASPRRSVRLEGRGAPSGTRKRKVWGRELLGMQIGGVFKRLPESGHFGVRVVNGSHLRVRMFSEEQRVLMAGKALSKAQYATGRLFKITALEDACACRDAELAKLKLHVVMNDEGRYRVEPMPEPQPAPGPQ